MKTILVIEDNNDILDNLTEYLRLAGYRVFASTNGKNGIDLAKKFIPDLIICDILMPEVDGKEVFHLLLHVPETSKIPFIFSTSICENIDGHEALKLGADDYITKPYDLDILLKMAES